MLWPTSRRKAFAAAICSGAGGLNVGLERKGVAMSGLSWLCGGGCSDHVWADDIQDIYVVFHLQPVNQPVQGMYFLSGG
jgi:hypothetical protein